MEIRWSKGGRPKNESAIPETELRAIIKRLGGQKAVASLMGCSRMTIARYLKGAKMGSDVAVRLRSLQAGAGVDS